MRRPVLLVLVAAYACAVPFGPGMPARAPRHAVVVSEADSSRCNRAYTGDEFRMPLALTEEEPSLAAELDAVPGQVRRTVLAAGLEPVLARMLRDRRTGTKDGSHLSFRRPGRTSGVDAMTDDAAGGVERRDQGVGDGVIAVLAEDA